MMVIKAKAKTTKKQVGMDHTQKVNIEFLISLILFNFSLGLEN